MLNGYQDPARRSVDRMIDDYLGLLNHGHLATATGNSDTHHLTFNMGGYPRNYLRVPDDRIGHVTPQDVAQAVRAHHVFFTTGPFVRMHAGQADIGDLVAAPSGHARVEIEVDAAPWVSVDRVILYVNGKEAQRWPVPPSQKVARFRASHEITLAADGYALVRADCIEICSFHILCPEIKIDMVMHACIDCAEDKLQNAFEMCKKTFRGADIFFDQCKGDSSGVDAISVLIEKAVQEGKAIRLIHNKSAAAPDKLDCFLRIRMPGAEENRNAVNSRLQHIVDPLAETSADIGGLRVAVERHENADTVDKYHLLAVVCIHF